MNNLIEFTHNLKVDRATSIQLIIQSIDQGDFADELEMSGEISE